jgi:hypothetical protein
MLERFHVSKMHYPMRECFRHLITCTCILLCLYLFFSLEYMT